MTVEELVTELKFQADPEAVDSFRGKVKSLNDTLLGLTKVFLGGVAVVGTWVKTTANVADETSKTAKRLNIATESLQEWRYAGKLSGLSNDEITNSLTKLNLKIGQAADGNATAAKSLGRLGIFAKKADGSIKSTDEVLEEMNSQLANIKDPATRATVAFDILGKSGGKFAQMLSESPEDLKALRAELGDLGGVFSKEAAEGAEKFNDNIDRMLTFVGGLKNEVAFALMPALNDMVENLISWSKANREVIRTKLKEFMQGIVIVLTAVGKVLLKFVQLFLWLIDVLGGFKRVASVIGFIIATLVTMKTIAVFMAFLKVLGLIATAIRLVGIQAIFTQLAIMAIPALIAAAVVALALIFEDLYTWINGGESMIGDYLGTWEDFRDKIVGYFKDLPGTIMKYLKALPGLWEKIFDFVLGLADQFVTTLIMFLVPEGRVRDGLLKIKMMFFGFLKFLTSFLTGGSAFDNVLSTIYEFGNAVKNFFSGIGDSIMSFIQPIIGWIESKIDKVKNFVGNFGFGGGSGSGGGGGIPTGGMPSPSSVARSEVTNSNSKSVNVNSKLTVQVPQGTPTSQKEFIEKQAQVAVKKEWEKILRETDNDVGNTE